MSDKPLTEKQEDTRAWVKEQVSLEYASESGMIHVLEEDLVSFILALLKSEEKRVRKELVERIEKWADKELETRMDEAIRDNDDMKSMSAGYAEDILKVLKFVANEPFYEAEYAGRMEEWCFYCGVYNREGKYDHKPDCCFMLANAILSELKTQQALRHFKE